MGSDGFESKKLGGPVSGGSAQNRLGTGEFSTGAARDPAIDALSGLGENLVEITGVIKWFDASKGYGFIVPDNGWPDVLLHVTVTPTSGLERAQVKWFNRLRGFGFLTCGEGTPDIFVHMETLRRFGMTELRPGQYVLVRYGPGSKGMMAAEIHPETGSPVASH